MWFVLFGVALMVLALFVASGSSLQVLLLACMFLIVLGLFAVAVGHFLRAGLDGDARARDAGLEPEGSIFKMGRRPREGGVDAR